MICEVCCNDCFCSSVRKLLFNLNSFQNFSFFVFFTLQMIRTVWASWICALIFAIDFWKFLANTALDIFSPQVSFVILITHFCFVSMVLECSVLFLTLFFFSLCILVCGWSLFYISVDCVAEASNPTSLLCLSPQFCGSLSVLRVVSHGSYMSHPPLLYFGGVVVACGKAGGWDGMFALLIASPSLRGLRPPAVTFTDVAPVHSSPCRFLLFCDCSIPNLSSL